MARGPSLRPLAFSDLAIRGQGPGMARGQNHGPKPQAMAMAMAWAPSLWPLAVGLWRLAFDDVAFGCLTIWLCGYVAMWLACQAT